VSVSHDSVPVPRRACASGQRQCRFYSGLRPALSRMRDRCPRLRCDGGKAPSIDCRWRAAVPNFAASPPAISFLPGRTRRPSRTEGNGSLIAGIIRMPVFQHGTGLSCVSADQPERGRSASRTLTKRARQNDSSPAQRTGPRKPCILDTSPCSAPVPAEPFPPRCCLFSIGNGEGLHFCHYGIKT
jgi:hypothetical protein